MDLRGYLQALKRRAWLIMAVFLTVVITATLASLRMTPIYEAQTRIEVQALSASNNESAILESLFDAGARMQTQVELMKSKAVLSKAAKTLGISATRPIERALDVKLVPDTQIIEITVEHERPEEASDWANAVANAYLDLRRERAIDQIAKSSEAITRRITELDAKIAAQDKVLGDLEGAAQGAKQERSILQAEVETLQAQMSAPQPAASPGQSQPSNRRTIDRIRQLNVRIAQLDSQIADYESGGSGPKAERQALLSQKQGLEQQRTSLPDTTSLSTGGGEIIVPAEVPVSAAKPDIPQNVLLAIVLGIALGVGLAFLAESLDDRIRSAEEVEQIVGAPILGHVPFVKAWSGKSGFLALIKEPASGASEAYRTLKTNLRFLSIDRPISSLLVTSSVAEEGKSTTAANLAVAFSQGDTRTVLVSGDLRKPSAHKFFEIQDRGGLASLLGEGASVADSLVANGIANFRLLPAGGIPPNPTEILASPRFTQVLNDLVSAADLVIIDAPPVLGLADAGAVASKVDGVLLVVDPGEVTRRNLKHAVDQINKAGGSILGAVMNSVEPREGYGYYYQSYYYKYGDEARKQAKDHPSSLEETRIPG